MAAQNYAVTTGNFLRNVISKFPKECSYCFAYGSGVFLQKNQKPGKMIDLIFVVDDPLKWHTRNLEINYSHYSGLRYFGPKLITSIQERMACGIYYNPFVKVDDALIKYGVISTAALEDDLSKWTHLYVAGRLHKPVLDIVPPTSPKLQNLLKKNRDAALRAGLLLNSRCLRKTDLYHTIAELSYMGDFRMAVGEHPDKVRNIVTPLVPYFDQIYYPLLEKLKPVVTVDKNGVITQDIDSNGRLTHLMGLPHPIQRSLARRIYRDPKVSDVEDAMVELSHVSNLSPYIRKSIAEVVWGSSILQTLQGILSAGVTRSIKYGLEKVKKKLNAKGSDSGQSEIVVEEKEFIVPDEKTTEIVPESPKSREIIQASETSSEKELVPISINDSEAHKLGRVPRKLNKEKAQNLKCKKVKGFHRQTIMKQADLKEA
jgi:translocator assembly and maintenance protein 41